MSGWLSQRLVERGIIKEEEQEIYQFGILVCFSSTEIREA